MKRMIFSALCALAATGAAFTQTGSPGAGPAPEPATISGNLGITGGMISLESGGNLYYVIGLNQLTGFIDGLKEGAAVSLTGYAFDSPRRPGVQVFRVTNLALNGKTYDLTPPAEFRRPGNGRRNWAGFPHGGNFRAFDDRRGSRGRGSHNRGWGGPDRRGPGRWD